MFARLVTAAIVVLCTLLAVVALLVWQAGRSPRRRVRRAPFDSAAATTPTTQAEAAGSAEPGASAAADTAVGEHSTEDAYRPDAP